MTAGQNRDQDIGSAKCRQRRTIQDREKEESQSSQVAENCRDAAPMVRLGILEQNHQRGTTLYAQHRAGRPLDNPVRVRTQTAQRLVHRASPQHNQVRALLPRFLGDGGHNFADRDAQRQV